MAGEAGPPWGRSGELQGPPPPRPGRQVAGRKLEREVARDARSRSVGRFPRGGGALPALAPRLGPATGRSVSGLPTATGPARPQGRYLGAPVTALGGGGREPAGGKRSRPFPRSRTGRWGGPGTEGRPSSLLTPWDLDASATSGPDGLTAQPWAASRAHAQTSTPAQRQHPLRTAPPPARHGGPRGSLRPRSFRPLRPRPPDPSDPAPGPSGPALRPSGPAPPAPHRTLGPSPQPGTSGPARRRRVLGPRGPAARRLPGRRFRVAAAVAAQRRRRRRGWRGPCGGSGAEGRGGPPGGWRRSGLSRARRPWLRAPRPCPPLPSLPAPGPARRPEGASPAPAPSPAGPAQRPAAARAPRAALPAGPCALRCRLIAAAPAFPPPRVRFCPLHASRQNG